MKARNKFKLYSVSAFVAIVGYALFAPQFAFAANGHIVIEVNTGSPDAPSTCYITGGGSSDAICPSTYGTFDSSSNTLTFGTGLNDIDSSVAIYAPGTVTLKSTGDIQTNIVADFNDGTYEHNSIVFDFGDYTFTDKGSAIGKASIGNFSYSRFTDSNLTMNSGVMNLRYFSCNNIVMNGGKLTIDENNEGEAGLMSMNDFIMNDGEIVIDNVERNDFNILGNFVMNGGTISISNTYGDGIFFNDGIINDGIINLKSYSDNEQIGIYFLSSLSVNGGNISIDGYWGGINLDGNGGIFFNGGVTTITNSSMFSVLAITEGDIYNIIHFADGIGIKEGKNFVYNTEESYAAIDANGTVTIMNLEDNNDYSSDSNDDVSNDIKAPDTGSETFSDNDFASQSPILTILAGIVATCLLTSYLKTRR